MISTIHETACARVATPFSALTIQLEQLTTATERLQQAIDNRGKAIFALLQAVEARGRLLTAAIDHLRLEERMVAGKVRNHDYWYHQEGIG